MVGHRFCEEIRRRDPHGSRIALTVLAAESRSAYNRILLPNVLAGVMHEDELALGDTDGVTVRTGTCAVALDPQNRTVLTSDGEVLAYDDLVLATGATAQIPKIPGIDRSVLGLRTVGDARRLNALAAGARRKHGRVVVLGGGVLGLEAARALAARGTAVTVVHPVDRPMERQVDTGGGRILAAAMRRTGVDLELGVAASWWEPGRGVWLTDGRLIPATGMLLSTGAAPAAGLARDAGLRLTESGAIAVDDALTTSDPAVHAIGDCAGHPGTPGGLVQPGWEQAQILASRLTGADPKARYRGSTVLTRLKAAGIELTCVGEGLSEDPDYEILRFEDPARERYAKLVISRDRIAGAIMIGLPDAAAGITQLYDRGAPAPSDRLALLLGRALPPDPDGTGAAGTGPGALPDHAIVCRCNMVTKAALRDAWYRGATCAKKLSAATRAATGCGTCGDDVDALAAWLSATDPSTAGTDPDPGRPDPDQPSPDQKEPVLS
jgi:assimilatory nitrate reductase electron transfer subunit